MLGPDNAIWDDGEWVSWDEINRQIQCQEWRAKYPNAKLSLVTYFEQLLQLAEDYFYETGKHLQLYGDIGELFGAITYGVDLHDNYTEGSDGRLGDDLVEIKTITPFKKRDTIFVKTTGNFNKLLVVKINEKFEISGKMVNREELPPNDGKFLEIRWSDLRGD